MQTHSHHLTTTQQPSRDLEQEAAQLEALLEERQKELTALQRDFRDFKLRYTQVVGSKLSELAEIERAIRQAEQRLLGIENEDTEEDEREGAQSGASTDDSTHAHVKTALRKIFWTVARMFHPDHASDKEEARRRHTVMAEANRAYRDGDIDSLHTLLGDQDIQFYCAGGHQKTEEDMATRILRLKEEIRTVDFGIKRIEQDGLYRIKLTVDEERLNGRDALAESAERIRRQIVKARRKLVHLGGDLESDEYSVQER